MIDIKGERATMELLVLIERLCDELEKAAEENDMARADAARHTAERKLRSILRTMERGTEFPAARKRKLL